MRRIAPTTVRSQIIHGNSWLLDRELGFSPAASGEQDSGNDARIGRDWFASAKRALLAPFGVGTVDQALLGVVAAKHFFVRHFASGGKSRDSRRDSLLRHLYGHAHRQADFHPRRAWLYGDRPFRNAHGEKAEPDCLLGGRRRLQRESSLSSNHGKKGEQAFPAGSGNAAAAAAC